MDYGIGKRGDMTRDGSNRGNGFGYGFGGVPTIVNGFDHEELHLQNGSPLGSPLHLRDVTHEIFVKVTKPGEEKKKCLKKKELEPRRILGDINVSVCPGPYCVSPKQVEGH